MSIQAMIVAAIAAGAVAGLDYTILPLVVSVAMRLGLVTPPPSFAWEGTPQAIEVAGTPFALGLLSNRLGRPAPLKAMERALSIPFATAALAAVGPGAVERIGVTGELVRHDGTAADLLQTGSYSGADAGALAGVGLVAVPLALLGKQVRSLTGRLPGVKAVQTGLVIDGVIVGALFSRLPLPLQTSLIMLAVASVVLLGVGIVRRAVRLHHWWQAEGRLALPRRRLAVLSELALPGAGAVITGALWAALPRLTGSLVLLGLFLVAGIAVVPLYLFLGLGGALTVASGDADDGLPPVPVTAPLGSAARGSRHGAGGQPVRAGLVARRSGLIFRRLVPVSPARRVVSGGGAARTRRAGPDTGTGASRKEEPRCHPRT